MKLNNQRQRLSQINIQTAYSRMPLCTRFTCQRSTESTHVHGKLQLLSTRQNNVVSMTIPPQMPTCKMKRNDELCHWSCNDTGQPPECAILNLHLTTNSKKYTRCAKTLHRTHNIQTPYIQGYTTHNISPPT